MKKRDKDNLLTTMALCAKLGVSRSWVNTHLRHLGSDPDWVNEGSRIRSVFYRESDVVKWLNDNAVCHVQTQRISLSKYATREQIEQTEARIRELVNADPIIPEKMRESIVYDRVMKALLPQNLYQEGCMVDARRRGDLPWVPVSRSITTLDDLRTVKDLSGGASPELGYREAFLRGMIRFEVDGRRWFAKPENDAFEIGEWIFLVPYQQR